MNRKFDVLGINLVIIRQADPYDKTGDATKGGRVAKFDFTKTFRNQLFSRVRVLYHQYLITNHSDSILKSKIMSIIMIIFVVVFSIQFVKKYFEVQL